MPKEIEITRKWYIIDAAGQSLGRTAAKAAHILNGKHKVTYAPHADCGDFVIVINCEKAVLTGKKLESKEFIWHTGWIGGLKRVSYKELMATKPEKAMYEAIKGMLPHNSLGAKSLTRLRVYRDANHKQQAQMPEAYEN